MNGRLLALTIVAVSSHAAGTFAEPPAANGCAEFRRDITRELAVMRAPPTAVVVRAQDGKPATQIEPERHYAVTLLPQEQVAFALAPARPARDPAPHGGALRFSVEKAGRYRISITSRHWVDVIAAGKSIDSVDHEGGAGCEVLHKIVEFDLPVGKPLTLQLSGSHDPVVGVAITAVSILRD